MTQEDRRKLLEGLLGFGACFALLGMATAAASAERDAWVPQEVRPLCALIGATCGAAAILILVLIGFRLSFPPTSLRLLSRLLLVLLFGTLALQTGTRYNHMCSTGSRALELGVLLGLPAVCIALILLFRRRSVGYLLAVALIAGVWLLSRPYLDWVHGE